MRRSLHLSGLGGQMKGGVPPRVAPELSAGSPATHWVLLVHVDLCRQDRHGGTAAGALAGTGPEMPLVGAGTVLLQGAPGAAGRWSGPRWAPPAPPCPASAPGSLTVSPGHTSRSRRRRPPRSPRRWHAWHRQRLSPGPSGGRGEGPAPWGISHGQGPETLGKLRLGAITGGTWGNRASPAEAVSTLGGEGLADQGDGEGRCSCGEEEREKARMSGGPVRLGLWPYLVGRHQIKVTGVCRVELHDMVHSLPVGHRHHPPAHHLHALIQVDLWGVGVGASG